MTHFGVSKRRAQRTLKHFRMKRFLFTAEDIEKQGIHLKGIKRENPQRYYLTEMKTQIIGNRKNNVQINTTEISTQNQHKVTHLQELLAQLSLILLYIHKLQLKTAIARENYDLLNLPTIGIAKVHRERIGQAQGPHNVEYHIHTNGTVMVFISCSDKPFHLINDDDIFTGGKYMQNFLNIDSFNRYNIYKKVWLNNFCLVFIINEQPNRRQQQKIKIWNNLKIMQIK